jgi:hypothetical protein
MKVVATAPMPGIRMPSRPVAGARVTFDCVDNELISPVKEQKRVWADG